ncbi:hypothetical protein EC973_007835, partial [Apophysomyces ossiformis]
KPERQTILWLLRKMADIICGNSDSPDETDSDNTAEEVIETIKMASDGISAFVAPHMIKQHAVNKTMTNYERATYHGVQVYFQQLLSGIGKMKAFKLTTA